MSLRLIRTLFSLSLLAIFNLSALSIKYAVSAQQGNRNTMEDFFDINVDNNRFGIGVYDGHGGINAAKFTQEELLPKITQAKKLKKQTFVDAFIKVDKDFLQKIETTKILDIDKQDNSGTTALVAIVDPTTLTLHLAWVGDSRAVLERARNIFVVTHDHKPTKQIIAEASYFDRKNNKIHISPMKLSVSRAIGDQAFKNELTKYKEKKMSVIAYPETIQVKLTGKENFLLLASDGFWDVFTNNEAIDLINKAFKQKQTFSQDISNKNFSREASNDKKLQMIVRKLRNAAYEKGSNDNITVALVRFKWENQDKEILQTKPSKCNMM